MRDFNIGAKNNRLVTSNHDKFITDNEYDNYNYSYQYYQPGGWNLGTNIVNNLYVGSDTISDSKQDSSKKYNFDNIIKSVKNKVELFDKNKQKIEELEYFNESISTDIYNDILKLEKTNADYIYSFCDMLRTSVMFGRDYEETIMKQMKNEAIAYCNLKTLYLSNDNHTLPSTSDIIKWAFEYYCNIIGTDADQVLFDNRIYKAAFDFLSLTIKRLIPNVNPRTGKKFKNIVLTTIDTAYFCSSRAIFIYTLDNEYVVRIGIPIFSNINVRNLCSFINDDGDPVLYYVYCSRLFKLKNDTPVSLKSEEKCDPHWREASTKVFEWDRITDLLECFLNECYEEAKNDKR